MHHIENREIRIDENKFSAETPVDEEITNYNLKFLSRQSILGGDKLNSSLHKQK